MVVSLLVILTTSRTSQLPESGLSTLKMIYQSMRSVSGLMAALTLRTTAMQAPVSRPVVSAKSCSSVYIQMKPSSRTKVLPS